MLLTLATLRLCLLAPPATNSQARSTSSSAGMLKLAPAALLRLFRNTVSGTGHEPPVPRFDCALARIRPDRAIAINTARPSVTIVDLRLYRLLSASHHHAHPTRGPRAPIDPLRPRTGCAGRATCVRALPSITDVAQARTLPLLASAQRSIASLAPCSAIVRCAASAWTC